MTDRPEGIVEITPTQIAEFLAVKWIGDPEDEAIAWMAVRFNWNVVGVTRVFRKNTASTALVIIGHNRKRYTITNGEWVVALGASGSLRVISQRTYEKDYREVST